MMGRLFVQESSKQFLVLKYSRLLMGHCGHGRSEVDQFPNMQSDTQPHTGMLDLFVAQQCR